jgi:glycosyltransferase involved in cell wall biosynthesis
MLPLSIVLCTFNREYYLNLALQSLLAQTLHIDHYELIIIDDGSTDGTAGVVESFKNQLPLRYFYQENRGLAAAKNHGLEEAVGEIVFFLDDDDIASPTLLEEHLYTHSRYPQECYAVLNYTTWAPQLDVTFFMRFITDVGRYLFAYPLIQDGDVLDYTYFWGGRSSCKRSLLKNHGMFNPIFRFGCEDIELGYRLSLHGLKVVYNANAISYMVRPLTLSDFLGRLLKQGRSQTSFSKLHPVTEVSKWCEIDAIEEEWLRMEPVYELAVKSALQLECVTNAKSRLGLEVDPGTERLFNQSLWNVFRATKVKGMIEGRQNNIDL